MAKCNWIQLIYPDFPTKMRCLTCGALVDYAEFCDVDSGNFCKKIKKARPTKERA